MSAVRLPASFADLEPFAARWSLASRTDRSAARYGASMEELRAFYDALLPRLDAVLEHLNSRVLKDYANEDSALLYLVLSLAEIGPAVEYFNSPEVTAGFSPDRFLPGDT